MQDEIGVQLTDSIAVVAKLIAQAVQDERRPVVVEKKGEAWTLQGPVTQDEISPVPG
jgi:hypothetical protein